jgi:acetoin utilization deacetylase AcuC-like enzyme
MLVVHHPDQALHDPEQVFRLGKFIPQPDRAQRYHVFLSVAQDDLHEIVQAPIGDTEPILAVHDRDYVAFLQTAWSRWLKLEDAGPEAIPNVHPTHRMSRKPTDLLGEFGWYSNSTSCPIIETTWTSVNASAQTAIHAADRLIGGEPIVYALCRPPGHHAFGDLMSGVCYLNNAAIAAERLARGRGKIAVLDFDVHHGNGTQAIFWTRPDILFCSIHCDPRLTAPFYAGYADEIGEGEGKGANLNIPMPFDTKDEAFLGAVDQAIAAIRRFGPTAIVVSTGFDASEHDPCKTFKITVGGFGETGRRLASLGLPTLLVQEGGYLNPFLGANLRTFLRAFEANAN